MHELHWIDACFDLFIFLFPNVYLSVVDSLMLPCFLLQYQTDEPVTLWVNKVGPYNNPQETYNYYSLPFCHPSENAAHKWGGLGEVLGGNELIDSQIDIKFQSMWTGCYLCILIYVVGLMDLFVFFFFGAENVDRATICQLELDDQKVKQFKDAIENSYWFEFFMGMFGIISWM